MGIRPGTVLQLIWVYLWGASPDGATESVNFINVSNAIFNMEGPKYVFK